MIGRPRKPTLFPYTPPPRSQRDVAPAAGDELAQPRQLLVGAGKAPPAGVLHDHVVRGDRLPAQGVPGVDDGGLQRSEEHTSELQSRQYLVCRLLLEKKKNQT